MLTRSFIFARKMSNFVQLLNPMTGMNEWKMVPEDYDYQQEVARAAFADMLHDSERVIYKCHMLYITIDFILYCNRIGCTMKD